MFPQLRSGRDYGLVLVATFAFALMAIFTRGAGAPILTVAAWRAVVVAVIFAGWAVASGGTRSLQLDRPTLKLGVGYGVALAIASSTFVGAYALTTVANTIFFHSLSPLAVFPLAWWMFKEEPSPKALAGTGVAVFGVALLSGASVFQFTHYADPRFLAGDLLAFASALGYGAVIVATRATRTQQTPLIPVLAVAWGVSALILCLIALVFGTLALPLSALPWVIGLAIISTNVPFYLLNLAMRTVPAGIVSLLSMSEVVFATLVGLVVYGESLAPIGWIGGALIVAGIAWPFVSRDEAGDAPVTALSEQSQPIRWARLGLRLLLFNIGAVLVLVEGDEVGALIVWAALVSVLRLGRPAAADLMGRAGAAMRWVVAALSGAVLLGLGGRGGWDDAEPALLGGLLVAGVWLADRFLLPRESDADRDADPLASAALLAIAAGIALVSVAHPLGPWVLRAAGGFVALSALNTALSALRDADTRGRGLDRIPGVFGTPGRLAALVGVVLLTGGVRVVPAGHVAVVERFGAPLPDAVPAGLLVRFPPPIERSVIVDVASIRQVELTGADTALLTGDQSLVTVQVTLYYTVSDPLAWALRAQNPEESLRAIGRGAMTEIVARLPLDSVLTTGRREVEDRVAALAQTNVDHVGIGARIEAIQLSKVAVPAPVQAAFLDVISAEEQKRGQVNNAEAYAAQVVPRARGEAAAVQERAQGDAAARASAAEGRAAWVTGVSRGGASAPALTRVRVWRERVAAALADQKLVLVPASVRIWLEGKEATPQKPPPKPTKGGSHG